MAEFGAAAVFTKPFGRSSLLASIALLLNAPEPAIFQAGTMDRGFREATPTSV